MSCGRKEWRSNESSMGTTCNGGRMPPRLSGLLDLDAQLHGGPHELREDAVLLGERERLLDPDAVLGEQRAGHGGPDHGPLEAIAAGRILPQLSRDLERKL